MAQKITFSDIKHLQEVRTYIKQADASLQALGYTEHSFDYARLKCRRSRHTCTIMGMDAKVIGFFL